MAKKKKLTDKQDQFCREYIIDFNATQAYKRVHPNCSLTTCASNGYKLLRITQIQQRIAELVKERHVRTNLTADQAMIECVRIATVDVGQAFNKDGTLKGIHDIPEDVRRAIAGFEVIEQYGPVDPETGLKEFFGFLKKVKFWSKDKQIENLFKHHGLFLEDNAQKGMSLAELISEAVGSE